MTTAPVVVPPDDDFNRTLVAHTHPPDHVNPVPFGRYNLVVLGGGTAGLVTAAVAAGLGARVALVEKHLLGGDCLVTGCVPSKAMLASARAAAFLRRAADFGLPAPGDLRPDFAAVMARLRRLRADLSPHDSVARFRRLGVDVYLGHGRFTGPATLQIGDAVLSFARAAVCTGSRPALPPIPGLAEAAPLTSDSIFSLTRLPARLAVIGGGPIGCELAQAFARLGSAVTLFERGGRLLPRDDPDAAALVQAALARDGVRLVLDAAVTRVERRGHDRLVSWQQAGQAHEAAADELLVATGRMPTVDGLGLEAASVAHDPRLGVLVDARLRTSNPGIYAAGDVCSSYQFTHAAEALAAVVVQNALFPHPFGLGTARADRLVIPWCTYTSPELAQVGLTVGQARTRGLPVDVFTVPFADVDRAVLDGDAADADGFVRLLVHRGTDRVVGATIVGDGAGELIGAVSMLMRSGRGLATLATTVFPYPTRSDALKKAAQAWRRTMLTPRRQRILSWLFRRARR